MAAIKRTFHSSMHSACYRPGSRLLLILGAGLIILGLLLLVFCVPLWAYLALIGLALIVLGVFLIQK